MASRVAYPGTESPGDILTQANFDLLPGGWIGYAEVTADQTGITTVADLTGLGETVTVNASRRIKIEGWINISSSDVSDELQFRIVEGATQIQRAEWVLTPTANVATWAYVAAVIAPSAGSHSYKLQAGRGGASAGTFALSASGTLLSSILITDIGPA